MVYLALVFSVGNVLGKSSFYIKGRDKSLIDLEKQDLRKWLDLNTWKTERLLKDQNPGWKKNIYFQTHKERFGKMISCHGKCKIYRGRKYLYGGIYSNIIEGDDIETEENSYAWVFLYDGSLIRISPNSSVSFKEFNVGEKEFFVYIRINQGNVLTLSRDKNAPEKSPMRETDSLFSREILRVFDYAYLKRPRDPGDVFNELLSLKEREQQKYDFLKEQMEKNNQMIRGKDTKFLVVFPNGSLFSNSLNAEIFVNLGGESYFELRDNNQVGSNSNALFLYRGYRKKESSILEDSGVYRVSPDGRELLSLNIDFFKFSKSLVRRIPSILLVRERWIEKYSLGLFEKNLDYELLAKKEGYRLWSGFDNNGELSQRISFLNSFTRKRETGYLVSLEKYYTLKKINIPSFETLPESFFQRALDHYARSLDRRKLKR